MSTQHIDVDSPEFEDAPRALRDAYKKLQKELGDVAKERDSFRSQAHSQALSSVLSDKGFKNPKRVERDLLADGIDPLDAVAVESWLTTNGDDYAVGTATPAEDPAQVQQQQNLNAIQNTVNDGESLHGMDVLERGQVELPADASPEQVLAYYRQNLK